MSPTTLYIVIAVAVVAILALIYYYYYYIYKKSGFNNESLFFAPDQSRMAQQRQIDKWGFQERNINYEDARLRAKAGYLANDADVVYKMAPQHPDLAANMEDTMERDQSQYAEHFTPEEDGGSQVRGAAADLDYNESLLTTLSPDIVKSHNEYVTNTVPFSMTTRNVDDFDIEPYFSFQGLRRPQGVAQSGHRLYVTEADGETFKNNKKFNFQG